ncbi:hypothetical protein AD006_13980 [Pseudonocardia sp. EC080610-09]|nr:hypothetical protein FRP1_06360 [Pseudonocardia sp. EC080625-04]ALL76146.1 hypothetical protein AD006_13980 [Pseudonocardia sp. EC080610-09]ALL83170.1 hypothetical protein AD017_21805 [Pseudonocardia sp. EC080619-01]
MHPALLPSTGGCSARPAGEPESAPGGTGGAAERRKPIAVAISGHNPASLSILLGRRETISADRVGVRGASWSASSG